MRTLPISKAKDQLSELVDAASTTRDQVTITKNGVPAAILIGTDEWDELQETLYWLSQPGVLEDLAQARRDRETGSVLTEDEVRARYRIPRK